MSLRPNREVPRWKRAVLGLLVSAVFLAVLEGVLRVVIPADALLLSWEREDGLLLYRSRTYVEGPADPAQRELWRSGILETRSNAATHHKDGHHPWSVRTNDQGLREEEAIPAASLSDRRYLALGDSWMFGVSATQGKSMPAQLERLLPSRLGVGSVQVVNGGIPGANGWHMLRRWNHLVDRMQMDGLVMGLPHNAPDPDVPERRRAWYANARSGPALNARLYLVLRRLLLPLGRPHYPDLLAADGSTDPSRDLHLAMTIADLRAITADAKARGIPVWLVLWPNDMTEALGGRVDLQRWSQPLAGLTMGGHALAHRSCWGHVDTWHPSEAGYRAIAHVVTEMMVTGEGSPTLQPQPKCSAMGEDGPGLR